MTKPLDIDELLRRGGEMNAAEVAQLAHELTEASLSQMSAGLSNRSLDQPIKVVPISGIPIKSVGGYFTQQKFICGKTPEEMEAILGIFGKLQRGSHILEFIAPLKLGDFESRAYSYLPDGKEYVRNPNEKVYLPGSGAPQWVLTRPVQTRLIATVRAGQVFDRDAFPGASGFSQKKRPRP